MHHSTMHGRLYFVIHLMDGWRLKVNFTKFNIWDSHFPWPGIVIMTYWSWMDGRAWVPPSINGLEFVITTYGLWMDGGAWAPPSINGLEFRGVDSSQVTWTRVAVFVTCDLTCNFPHWLGTWLGLAIHDLGLAKNDFWRKSEAFESM